ncbi:MAG: F-type H+-transporting ATPase subunit b [Oceanicaulis sp. HLUCCA04]|nr:MAG: F-type H+-transporting ATPase subunit b [Oceanicaulis sp. HLUCCA04]
MSYLLQDTSFWAFIGLLAFFAILWRFGIHKVLATNLDARANTIRNELDEARRLREEAQEMLAKYERQQRDAANEAEEIVKKAKLDAEFIRQNARKELADRIERRTALAEQRIAQAEAQAAKDVKALAAEIAVEAAAKLLSDKLTKTQRNALVKDAAGQLAERLN